ncbi:MAG TPA: RNase adapter RapZ [Ignavibacteria bacterium]|nr:RNase adapter RapZ [Ignavibacteria bacterium]
MSLKVKIFSFSYKYSTIPEDTSGNGGGFVFDCRFIDNPGRIDKFKDLTGLDKEVSDYLDETPAMQDFLWNVYRIITPVIENYIIRDFTDLQVSFGCTGGRHRSVYSAENLAKYLSENYPQIETEIIHSQIYINN